MRICKCAHHFDTGKDGVLVKINVKPSFGILFVALALGVQQLSIAMDLNLLQES